MRVCVCVCVGMSPVCPANTERNELKFGTLTVSGVGLLQPLEALAAMQIVGVASENVRWGHENSPKFTSKVKH